MPAPCDNPPDWPKAPAFTRAPLKDMKWSTSPPRPSRFGCTRDGGTKFHAGIDLKAEVGTPCYATEDAIVKDVGYFGDLGTCVGISFEKGGKTYGLGYCHLDSTSVTKGSLIKAGAEIGKTGISGNASADNPHLHLEVQTQVWTVYKTAAERSKVAADPNDYVK